MAFPLNFVLLIAGGYLARLDDSMTFIGWKAKPFE
jgi:hypothetical protein